MDEFKFCPLCKTELVLDFVEGRDRLTCKNCGWILYSNPLPVVSCLCKNSRSEILLIKRAVEPAVGKWALPGGFLENDETPAEAGSRELKEETGLTGNPVQLVDVLVHDSPMYGRILIIGFVYNINESEKMCVGDDANDAAFFSLDKLPEIPFPSHITLIDKFTKIC